jgi:prevent-host-death family protein
MSTHGIADAKNHLPKLIDRALNGEEIVITRRGQPVIVFKPIRPAPRPMTDADIEWLRARRRGRKIAEIDAATQIRQMREEGEV